MTESGGDAPAALAGWGDIRFEVQVDLLKRARVLGPRPLLRRRGSTARTACGWPAAAAPDLDLVVGRRLVRGFLARRRLRGGPPHPADGRLAVGRRRPAARGQAVHHRWPADDGDGQAWCGGGHRHAPRPERRTLQHADRGRRRAERRAVRQSTATATARSTASRADGTLEKSWGHGGTGPGEFGPVH